MASKLKVQQEQLSEILNLQRNLREKEVESIARQEQTKELEERLCHTQKYLQELECLLQSSKASLAALSKERQDLSVRNQSLQ